MPKIKVVGCTARMLVIETVTDKDQQNFHAEVSARTLARLRRAQTQALRFCEEVNALSEQCSKAYSLYWHRKRLEEMTQQLRNLGCTEAEIAETTGEKKNA